MKTPDGKTYEEIWDEDRLVTRKLVEESKVDDTAPTHERKSFRAISIAQNIPKQPRTPKVYLGELSALTTFNVTEYMNEKLLLKNSKMVF